MPARAFAPKLFAQFYENPRSRQMFSPVDAGEPTFCSLIIPPHIGAAMAANRADE